MNRHTIRARRKQMHLTQAQLARAVGATQQQVSRIESGRSELRDPELRGRLARVLGFVSEPGVRPQVPAELRRFLLSARVEEPQIDPGPTWFTLTRHKQSPPSWLPCGEFLRATRADARAEVTALEDLCAAGAQPCYLSPVLCGFYRHPLVDGAGWALGTRPRAALYLAEPQWSILVFPQVLMRLADTTVRPDALVRVERGAEVTWCVYELDGVQHELLKDLDARRDERLDLDVLRFPNSILSSDPFEQLLREALQRRYRLVAC